MSLKNADELPLYPDASLCEKAEKKWKGTGEKHFCHERGLKRGSSDLEKTALLAGRLGTNSLLLCAGERR